MSNSSTHTPRFGFFRRLWKPAVATGVAIWFDEIMAFSQELLALIFLPIIAGTIYLLDNFIFKSCMPCREDMKNMNDTGEKN